MARIPGRNTDTCCRTTFHRHRCTCQEHNIASNFPVRNSQSPRRIGHKRTRTRLIPPSCRMTGCNNRKGCCTSTYSLRSNNWRSCYSNNCYNSIPPRRHRMKNRSNCSIGQTNKSGIGTRNTTRYCYYSCTSSRPRPCRKTNHSNRKDRMSYMSSTGWSGTNLPRRIPYTKFPPLRCTRIGRNSYIRFPERIGRSRWLRIRKSRRKPLRKKRLDLLVGYALVPLCSLIFRLV